MFTRTVQIARVANVRTLHTKSFVPTVIRKGVLLNPQKNVSKTQSIIPLNAGKQLRSFANGPNFWGMRKNQNPQQPQYHQQQNQQPYYPQQQYYDQNQQHYQQQYPSQQGYQQPYASQYQPPYGYQHGEVERGPTLMDHLATDVGFKAFMRNVAKSTATGILTAGISAAAVISLAPQLMGLPLIIGSAIGSFACLMGINRVSPTYYQQNDGTIVALDPPSRRTLSTAFYGLMGAGMAPLLAYASMYAPTAIPIAGALTVTTMAGMMTYALSKPTGALDKWGAPLTVGLFGLIGCGILSFFVKSSALFWITSVGGIGIFAAFTALDMHSARQMYEMGQPDHTLASVNFFLNFANLFQDFLRIILHWNNDQ